MTIRFRNRITLVFFVLSTVCLALGLIFTGIQIFSGSFTTPQIYEKISSENFLLTYRPWCTLAGIFLILLYTCITSLIIFHSFEKTQAPDMAFFLLFLLACLCDASRLVVPLMHLSQNYSLLLLKIGNIQLFARLIAPLALMGTTILSSEELKQNTDKNCLILIITAIFFAEFIPLNTAVILPNFNISYGYVKPIRLFSFAVIIMSSIALFISNRKNDYRQLMTLGFIMLSLGYTLIFYCFNILVLVSGAFFLGLGTTFFLNETHRHYLWID